MSFDTDNHYAIHHSLLHALKRQDTSPIYSSQNVTGGAHPASISLSGM